MAEAQRNGNGGADNRKMFSIGRQDAMDLQSFSYGNYGGIHKANINIRIGFKEL